MVFDKARRIEGNSQLMYPQLKVALSEAYLWGRSHLWFYCELKFHSETHLEMVLVTTLPSALVQMCPLRVHVLKAYYLGPLVWRLET